MSSRSWIRNMFARTPRTIRKAPARFRPRFESLEDRITPTAYYVTNSNDDLNSGSLRWAITQANANPGADVIDNIENDGIINAITIPHSINLTLLGTQLPAITGDLTILGHNTFTVSGNDLSRVFSINSGVNVQINGLTITDGEMHTGNKSGGAIFNQGTLSIVSSTISASDAGSGGGIFNSGTLSISSSTLSDNGADTGGAIFNQGTVSITGSTISGNLAGVTLGFGGRTSNTAAQGGGVYSFGGAVTLDHVTLTQNTARGGTNSLGIGFIAQGGGLYAAGVTVTIVDSTISSNTARGGDGATGAAGAAGTPTTIISDTGSPGGRGDDGKTGGLGGAASGGGVYATGSQVSLFGTTVNSNAALGGAGGAGGAGGMGATGGDGSNAIPDLSGQSVVHPAFPGGRGGDGGTGGLGGTGAAASGGGVYFDGSALSLSNSTIANNKAGGGMAGAGGPGGIAGNGGHGGSGVVVTLQFVPGADGGAGGNGGAGGKGGSGGSSDGGGLERANGSLFVGSATIAYNQASAGSAAAGAAGGPAGFGGTGGVGTVGGQNNGVGTPGKTGPNGVAGSSAAAGVAGAASSGGIAAGAGAAVPNDLFLANTIVALNTAGGAASDVTGSVDPNSAYNLIGTGAGGMINGSQGNLVGVANPGLGVLANNGGPTQTIALLSSSPALEAGSNDDATSLALFLSIPLLGQGTDQRGSGFPRIIGANVDIGAFESQYGASSLVVTTLADEDNGYSNPALGDGTSLREAINWANLHPGADIITFAPGLSGAITLGGAELPEITGDLSITAPGADELTISGNGASRVLEIAAGTKVLLVGVSIVNGKESDGGAIYNSGALSVFNSVFSGNAALTDGGAIYSDGSLQVVGSSFTGNSANGGHGGAIHNDDGKATVTSTTLSNNTALIGGAIENFDQLVVSGDTFSNNSASAFGSSIANGGTLTVTNTTFSGGAGSQTFGGGIYNAGTAQVTGSDFSQNDVNSGSGIYNANNGSLTVNTSTFTHNTHSSILNASGTATVTGSTFTGNTGSGGGINNQSTLTVSTSTFSGNDIATNAARGGGIFNSASLTVSNSTFSGNQSGFGGGIYNTGTAVVNQSTFSGNTPVRGGGIYSSGTLTVTSSTIAGNIAQLTGGGIQNLGTLTLANTIVAGNLVGSTPSDLVGTAGPGSTFNLIGDVNTAGGLVNGVNGNLVGIDPKLGALADNGGPTQTMALLPFSPALEAGSNALVPAGVTTDQRGAGFTRIRGAVVDIGAYEIQDDLPSIGQFANAVVTNEGSSNFNFGGFFDAQGYDTVTVTSSVGTVNQNNETGSWVWSYTPTDGPGDSAPVTITATDNFGMQWSTTFQLTVNNVAPGAAITGAPVSGHGPEGTTITLGSTVYDPSSVDTNAGFVYAWSVTKNGVSYSSGNLANFSFTPDDNGTFVVTMTATDKDGGVSSPASTTIVVDNVAPTASLTGIPISGHSPEGTTITLGSTVTDPSSVDSAAGFTLAWTVTKNGVAFASGTTAGFSFTPDDDGSYMVTLTASDNDGGVSPLASATITVDNVAPTIAISGAASVTAGATYTLNLGAVTDPGADTVSNYTVNWGDGTSDNYTSGGAKTHVYTTGGVSRAITVDLTDEDGTYTNRANGLGVTVNTVIAPPTVTVPGAQTANVDVDKAIAGITVASGNGGNLTVTLIVARGKLTLAKTTGLTVTGNQSGTVKLTGTAAALNAALAGLVYRGNSNLSGADTLNVTVAEGSLNASGSVAITVSSAAQQAASLQAQVAALKSAGKLTSAQAALLNGGLNLQNNILDVVRVGVFLLEVELYRLTGLLTQAQADALLTAGNTLLLSVTRR